MTPPERAERSNLFQVLCPNQLPAERCVLLMWPSMHEREQALQVAADKFVGVPRSVMNPLEAHGVDEIDCRWEGVLPMTERLLLNSGGQTEYVADCPRCGQEITLR